MIAFPGLRREVVVIDYVQSAARRAVRRRPVNVSARYRGFRYVAQSETVVQVAETIDVRSRNAAWRGDTAAGNLDRMSGLRLIHRQI